MAVFRPGVDHASISAMAQTVEIHDTPATQRHSITPDAAVFARRGIVLREHDEGLGLNRAVPSNEPCRIAYLTNAYPKVSHSFIRNEILALEREGVAVQRITIRSAPEALIDPIDRSEQDRTAILLNGQPIRLLGCVMVRAARSPLRFVAAARLAVAMGLSGSAGLLRSLAYFVEACRLVRMLEVQRIRHVHVHFGTNPAAVAHFASKLGRITYSMTVHGPDEFDEPRPLHLPAKIADARFVVAVSEYGRAQLLRWSAPKNWNRIVVVRCGTDSHFLHHPVEGREEGLQSARLVCVARLSAQKGISLLIDAADIVARERPFELRIIGDGELRRQIEAQILARGLQHHVRLLGWQGREAIAKEILAARAFVLPSFAEGLPVVLMEALALERPVIVTAVAGIPELVDPQIGWLVPAGSATALADAMRSALQIAPNMLASMGAMGRARVLRDHDAATNAALLAQFLRPLA